MSESPYLSVVVTTRNDDHGGNPLGRFQAFVDCLDAQCRRTGLDAELIVVDWNPPVDRPRLAEVIRRPENHACTYRFVEVPPSLHQTLPHSEAQPLFQMIGKNVGIRRARGRFVLSANMDVLLSNELADFLASRTLEPACLYRVDRCDVEADLPEAPLESRLEYCRTHQLRVNARWGTYPVDSNGHLRTEANDVADGQAVSLVKGWHLKEGNVRGAFRWAMPEASVSVRPSLESSAVSVLDITAVANPFDAEAWTEVEIAAAGAVIGRVRIAERAVYRLPLGGATGEITIRVAGSRFETPRFLPVFERRRALAYVVESIEQRQVAGVHADAHPFPRAPWQPVSGSEVQPSGSDAVAVTAMVGGYAAKYGPLLVQQDGVQWFSIRHEPAGTDVMFGALTGDEKAWLPFETMPIVAPDGRSTRLAVTLTAGQTFWLVASLTVPAGDSRAQFSIERLSGSKAPVIASSAQHDPRSDEPSLTRAPGRVGQMSSNAFDALMNTAPDGMRRTLDEARHGLVLVSPEYQAAVEEGRRQREQVEALGAALHASQQQVAELSPLAQMRGVFELAGGHRPPDVHLNACGDFQLLARDSWFAMGAFPEFHAYSMSIDGLFGTLASFSGIRECALQWPRVIFHLEHGAGSGWTPEHEDKLRARLRDKGIPWIDSSVVTMLAAYMAHLECPMRFNGPNWGFGDVDLPEVTFPGALAR